MRRRLFALVLAAAICCGPRVCRAAIALDAASNGASGSSVSSLSWSHTCTGSNLILWVHVLTYQPLGGATQQTSTVTDGGTAMALVSSGRIGDVHDELWMLLAPATGTHTIQVMFIASINYGSGQSASYTGAAQTGQPDATNYGAVASAGSETVSVTTVANNAWVVGGASTSNATAGPGTGTTLRGSSSNGSEEIVDSGGPITPAGSASLVATASTTTTIGMAIASFSPAGGGGPACAPTLTLLGVGRCGG